MRQNQGDHPRNNQDSHCPAVVSSFKASGLPDSQLPTSFWETRVVPIHHPLPGITHKVIDLSGRNPDVVIGTPKGPQPIVRLKIHGN